MLRLHLGCGQRLLEGWVNVDLPGGGHFGKTPDLEHDLTKPLPYEDATADEVFSSHVFEHFERWTAEDVLTDWVRVLKPGGRIVLEMPCFDKIVGYVADCVDAGRPIDLRMSLWGLYGDPRHGDPSMMHRWCYSRGEILAMFKARGLDAEVKEPLTHIAARDMRIEGVKRGD